MRKTRYESRTQVTQQMETERPASQVQVAEIAAALLGQAEVAPRARILASYSADCLPDSAAAIYVITNQEHPIWVTKATAGEIVVAPQTEFRAGTLGALAETQESRVFECTSLQREDYSHLDIRRTAISLAYAPLLSEATLVGALELISFDQPIPADVLQVLSEIAEIAAPSIAAALKYEEERNISLQAISRVTQMYDLEKVFNSTLEMDELLEMIAKKFQEVTRAQGINLWMVVGDEIELMAQGGFDGTVRIGSVQRPGDGIAGDISETGKAVLISDPEDPRMQKRNRGFQDDAVFSLVAAPLMEHESLVGVIEAVNRVDGEPFNDDDEFLLANICETASNALHNAYLLQAERKVEVLEALVKVSAEITSTLDLDRVLHAVVTEPGNVIPYERAAIALEQGGHLQVRAATGVNRINPQDPDIARLQDLLEWTSLLSEPILISQHGDEITEAREETVAKFKRYFEQTGMQGFHSVPLADDDGRVGILCFESRTPDFLTGAHLEMIKVLAGQATVALRNASLYREVPFITVLEPILARKRKFMAMKKRRRILSIGAVAATLIFLAAFPLPLRVDGPAIVAAAHTAQVQPAVAGTVKSVNVHEGDSVSEGAVIAALEDWQYRAALAAAQAKYEIAVSEMNHALTTNDGTEAGIQRVEADYWKSEVARSQQRLDRTLLRAPINGRIATPHMEDLVGRSLDVGDTFAEIVDTSQVTVDVAIDDQDVMRLHSGEEAAVKLQGLPVRTFHAPVEVVSPKAELQGNERLFFARMVVPNPNGLIHPGMQGRGKVSTGWAPAGWVLFRRPAMWLWSKVWSVAGW